MGCTTLARTRTSGTERMGCPLTVRCVTEAATGMIFIIIAIIMLVIRVVISNMAITIELVSTMALIDLMGSSACIKRWLTAMMVDTDTLRRDSDTLAVS